ncbi:MAG: MT-A70 family methyltransferase [Sandaracinaceae bacterium]
MKVGGYETHPAADLFPMMEEAGLRELAADIKRTGQRHAVVVIGSKILDGRNRVRACEMIGVEPRFSQYEGPKDVASLLDYVVSLNLSRRHLSPSQRAWLGALLEEKYAEAGTEKKREGGRRGGQAVKHGADRPHASESDRAPRARDRAAAAVGSSGRSVQKAKTVRERTADEVQRAVVSGELTVDAASELAKIDDHDTQRAILERSNGKPGNIRAHIRQHQQREIAKELEKAPPPPPSGPYRVIVADPPWKYDLRATDATHRGNLPYPPMTTDAICALPVGDLAEEGSVLWMWVTNGHLLGSGGVSDGLRVVHAWGFEPKALLTWVKPKLGLGHYLRNVTEHCILAVRGKPTIVLDNESTLLEAPVREHSRKPDEFFALVEKLTPGSKIELFAREPREGWAAWGAEVDKFAGVTSR